MRRWITDVELTKVWSFQYAPQAHHKRQELAAAARRSIQRRDAARPSNVQELWHAGETQLAKTLQEAMEENDVARVVALVQRGAPLNLENRWGLFPLLVAVLARDTGGCAILSKGQLSM